MNLRTVEKRFIDRDGSPMCCTITLVDVDNKINLISAIYNTQDFKIDLDEGATFSDHVEIITAMTLYIRNCLQVVMATNKFPTPLAKPDWLDEIKVIEF